jgi:dipeptidyl aminopeptidase/acylaminoacyl peptidase
VKLLRAALGALSLAFAALAFAQDPLAGAWKGHWIRKGTSVDITMRFTAGASGYTGSFDSDGLRVAEIPMRAIRVEGILPSGKSSATRRRRSSWESSRAKKLTGRLMDRGQEGDFEFHRVPAEPLPRREEVTFRNGAVTLSGTLMLPESSACERHPGVVFLHGSGPEGRWASTYLAGLFAKRGFVALVYDKRGVAKSTGDWRTAGFEELAADAAAAIAMLRARPDVDPALVGIHGHSQGATIAPLAATQVPDLAFIIASAAAATMAETEMYSLANSMRVKTLPPDDARLAHAYLEAVVGAAYGTLPRAKVEEVWDQVRGKPWAFPLPEASHHYWAFSKRIASYRPTDHWRRVSAPALLLYGDLDERVPPRSSAEAITAAYGKGPGPKIDVVNFAGAGPYVQVPPASSAFAWPKTVAGYPDAIFAWTAKSLKACRR